MSLLGLEVLVLEGAGVELDDLKAEEEAFDFEGLNPLGEPYLGLPPEEVREEVLEERGEALAAAAAAAAASASAFRSALDFRGASSLVSSSVIGIEADNVRGVELMISSSEESLSLPFLLLSFLSPFAFGALGFFACLTVATGSTGSAEVVGSSTGCAAG